MSRKDPQSTEARLRLPTSVCGVPCDTPIERQTEKPSSADLRLPLCGDLLFDVGLIPRARRTVTRLALPTQSITRLRNGASRKCLWFAGTSQRGLWSALQLKCATLYVKLRTTGAASLRIPARNSRRVWCEYRSNDERESELLPWPNRRALF